MSGSMRSMQESFLLPCQEARIKFIIILETFTTAANARRLLRLGEIQVARMVCGKPALSELPNGTASSEDNKARFATLLNNWLCYVTKVLPQSQLFESYGTTTDAKDAAQDRSVE